ncbi:TPA: hypothetical protein NNA44_004401 [Escherichia coli]|nr:hypothetical protein [Escherichia coli]HAV9253355.1 hypothetical protein [Escherichia coli]HAW0316580.1 hypothetical protein [Escherichia coli]HAW1122971.1 hypothetical protein [Escherichia coli]HCH7642725.1 hypothetical protein [Escherichia coli]
MKIKYLIFCDFLFIFLIFIYLLVFSSSNYRDGIDYVGSVLLLPHAIIIPPCIWYFSFFNILKKAGDDVSIVASYKLVTVLFVLFVSLCVFSYLYFWRYDMSGDNVRSNVLFYLTAVSHALGGSTAILLGAAAYRMFIRMSARGYRKLMK